MIPVKHNDRDYFLFSFSVQAGSVHFIYKMPVFSVFQAFK